MINNSYQNHHGIILMVFIGLYQNFKHDEFIIYINKYIDLIDLPDDIIPDDEYIEDNTMIADTSVMKNIYKTLLNMEKDQLKLILQEQEEFDDDNKISNNKHDDEHDLLHPYEYIQSDQFKLIILIINLIKI